MRLEEGGAVGDDAVDSAGVGVHGNAGAGVVRGVGDPWVDQQLVAGCPEDAGDPQSLSGLSGLQHGHEALDELARAGGDEVVGIVDPDEEVGGLQGGDCCPLPVLGHSPYADRCGSNLSTIGFRDHHLPWDPGSE